MNRAEATISFLDTLDSFTANDDLLRMSARARKIANAAMETRLVLALATLPDASHAIDDDNELATVAADIAEDYDLDVDGMQEVLQMCRYDLGQDTYE